MSQSFNVKLGEIAFQMPDGSYALVPSIGAVANAKRVPIKAQYHLSRIVKELAKHVVALNDRRAGLIKELGKQDEEEYEDKTDLDENQQPKKKTRKIERWSVMAEQQDAYVKSITELLDVDVEINLRPMKLSELGEPEGTKPADFVPCQNFIIDE